MREEVKNTKKLGNKGFSLIELIIVIAIMAILVGIVGTQVVPFLEKSREAKDEQIISSVLTCATAAFASNAADCEVPTSGTQSFTLWTTNSDSKLDQVRKDTEKLFNYDGLASGTHQLKQALKSKEGAKITSIVVERDSNGIVTGYRQPIPWEQYQQYLLLQQQRELEMYKLNLLNQSLNRTVNTNCFTTGGFTHCSTY